MTPPRSRRCWLVPARGVTFATIGSLRTRSGRRLLSRWHDLPRRMLMRQPRVSWVHGPKRGGHNSQGGTYSVPKVIGVLENSRVAHLFRRMGYAVSFGPSRALRSVAPSARIAFMGSWANGASRNEARALFCVLTMSSEVGPPARTQQTWCCGRRGRPPKHELFRVALHCHCQTSLRSASAPPRATVHGLWYRAETWRP